MKSVPYFLRGGYRAAVRLALEEIVSGWVSGDVVKQERGWKLFFLLPRMLLSRPCRGGLVPRRKLETRFQKFFAGDWAGLVADSEDLTSQASTARVRRSRRRQKKKETLLIILENLFYLLLELGDAVSRWMFSVPDLLR